MTEVLFAASVAFVGYVIYVLVDEQMASANTSAAEIQPVSSVNAGKPITPKPIRARTKSPQVRKVATTIINVTERVGTAAGSIWNYLNENGPTAVTKLVNILPEDNKTLQRSIGWLAQEDKITLETISRRETIALKE